MRNGNRNPFNNPLTVRTNNDQAKGVHHYQTKGSLFKNENLSHANQLKLESKSTAMINEALFIGIISKDTSPHFLKLARYSEVGFSTVKEILHIEKQGLIKRYDQLRAVNKLEAAPREDFEMMYRAKHLQNPIYKSSNINHLQK